MTDKEYLNQLTDKSAWVFTKQDTSFDETFKATKLFADVCGNSDINVEEYFAKHHEEYGINTDRHRVLVIPQMFGLITKTPFYTRGIQYNKERPTEIFDLIKNEQIGSNLYNTIKTEQLLKIKIHSIIDTANNNEDYNILPVIFIYKVLKELQLQHNINEVSLDHFYTYIITCKSFADASNAVEYIAKNSKISEYVGEYKDKSRVLTIIRNNISLFNITTESISINPVFDEYFYHNFVENHDLDELHEQLLRDIDYSYLLYNNQEFKINLIDNPEPSVATLPSHAPKGFKDDEETEKDYLEKVDSIKENNVNDDVAFGAYNVAPVATIKTRSGGRTFKINPILGKLAIKHAYYSCECNREHRTFLSNRTKKQYMEAHHLVPVAFQQEMWGKFNINIDCLENLVSLCPICHKAFHYGTPEVKTTMIEDLFSKVLHKYKDIGFSITLEEVKELYGIPSVNKTI